MLMKQSSLSVMMNVEQILVALTLPFASQSSTADNRWKRNTTKYGDIVIRRSHGRSHASHPLYCHLPPFLTMTNDSWRDGNALKVLGILIVVISGEKLMIVAVVSEYRIVFGLPSLDNLLHR